jgi:hypothetical protein
VVSRITTSVFSSQLSSLTSSSITLQDNSSITSVSVSTSGGVPESPISSDDEGDPISFICNYQFSNYKCPGVYWSKVSDGTIITYPQDSPEANIAKKREAIFYQIANIYFDFDYRDLQRSIEFQCVICLEHYHGSDIFNTHLEYKEKRLLSKIVALLDARQLEPGESIFH